MRDETGLSAFQHQYYTRWVVMSSCYSWLLPRCRAGLGRARLTPLAPHDADRRRGESAAALVSSADPAWLRSSARRRRPTTSNSLLRAKKSSFLAIPL